MRIIVEKNYEEMSKTAMHLLLGAMYQNRHMNVSITAGSTPARLYELMVEEMKNKAPFPNVIYHNFDEIPIGRKPSAAQSPGYCVTMTNLNRMFFDPAGIDTEQIHILDESNYMEHDDYLKSIGGLDFLMLGIGSDEHFCGNLPGTTAFSDATVKVSLDSRPALKETLAAETGGAELVPEFYVTMGPKSVMAVREIVMIASGKAKAKIICQAFTGPVTEQVPSSIFQMHPNFTLILDQDAASEL